MGQFVDVVMIVAQGAEGGGGDASGMSAGAAFVDVMLLIALLTALVLLLIAIVAMALDAAADDAHTHRSKAVITVRHIIRITVCAAALFFSVFAVPAETQWGWVSFAWAMLLIAAGRFGFPVWRRLSEALGFRPEAKGWRHRGWMLGDSLARRARDAWPF